MRNITIIEVHSSISFQAPTLDMEMAQQFILAQAYGTKALDTRVDTQSCVVIEKGDNVTLPLADDNMRDLGDVLVILGVWGYCADGKRDNCAASVKFVSDEGLIYLHEPKEKWIRGKSQYFDNYWPHWFLMKGESITITIVAEEKACLRWASVWAKDAQESDLDEEHWKKIFETFDAVT